MKIRVGIASILLILSLSLLFVGISTASISPLIPNKTDVDTSNNIVVQSESTNKTRELAKQRRNYIESQIIESENIESENIEISDCIVIGDSNTVRMDMYDTSISEAKHISAIVGVGVGGFDNYTNSSNTTSGRTIKSDLDKLNDSYFQDVVIMLGTNDYNKDGIEFINQYKSILDYVYDRNSNAKVYMVTIPPVNNSKSPSIQDNDADRISYLIADMSNNYNKLDIELIDLNNYLSASDMSSDYGDGYHFSKSGAEKAAEYIVENL